MIPCLFRLLLPFFGRFSPYLIRLRRDARYPASCGRSLSSVSSRACLMTHFDLQLQQFVGSAGSLSVLPGDEVTLKLAMLLEGECSDLGPLQAALKFGFSKQRYFQIRHAFKEQGSSALCSQKRAPIRNYRRTDEVVRQIIRHRFLDPDASADVIAQNLRQAGWVISTRSVERTIAYFGLQKKTS